MLQFLFESHSKIMTIKFNVKQHSCEWPLANIIGQATDVNDLQCINSHQMWQLSDTLFVETNKLLYTNKCQIVCNCLLSCHSCLICYTSSPLSRLQTMCYLMFLMLSAYHAQFLITNGQLILDLLCYCVSSDPLQTV